jgi:hypothetical protein
VKERGCAEEEENRGGRGVGLKRRLLFLQINLECLQGL